MSTLPLKSIANYFTFKYNHLNILLLLSQHLRQHSFLLLTTTVSITCRLSFLVISRID